MENINETSVGTMLPQVGLDGKESKGVISAKNMIAKMASTAKSPVSYKLTEAMIDYMSSRDAIMNERTYNLLISEAEELSQSMDIEASVSPKFIAKCSRKSALKVKLKLAAEKIKKRDKDASEEDLTDLKKDILDYSAELEKQSEEIQKEVDSLPDDTAKLYKKCEKASDKLTNEIYKKYSKNIASLSLQSNDIETSIHKELNDMFKESAEIDHPISLQDEVYTEGFADIMFFIVSGILTLFLTFSPIFLIIQERKKNKEAINNITRAIKNIDKYFKEHDKKNYISLYDCTFKQLSLLPTAKNDDIDQKTKETIKSAIRKGYLGLVAYVDKENRGVVAAGYTKDTIYYNMINKKYEDYLSFYMAQISWHCFGFISETSAEYLNKIAADIYKEDHVNIYKEGSSDMLTEKDLRLFYENDNDNETKKEDDNDKKDEKKETVSPEVKRLDELRGKVADLQKEVKKNKDLYDVTNEQIYEKKVKGLQAKLDQAKEELKKGEEKAKREEERIAKESTMFEKADLDPEMKPIVDKFNSKGYHVKYASPGHENLRKKEDRNGDGSYYNKLYSDARVMFEQKYKFPDPPKFWHWREVDGCSYLDVTPLNYYPDRDGTPDQAFSKWKAKYMSSLMVFVDELDPINGSSKETEKEDEVKESVEFSSFIDDMYEDYMLSVNNATESVENSRPVKSSNERLLSELDRLLR